jgi:hypothetical protein
MFSRMSYNSVPLIEQWMLNECILFLFLTSVLIVEKFYTRRHRAECWNVTGFKYHVEFCNTKIPSVLEMALRLKCIVLPR